MRPAAHDTPQTITLLWYDMKAIVQVARVKSTICIKFQPVFFWGLVNKVCVRLV